MYTDINEMENSMFKKIEDNPREFKIDTRPYGLRTRLRRSRVERSGFTRESIFERGFRPTCEVKSKILDPRTRLSTGNSPFFVDTDEE